MAGVDLDVFRFDYDLTFAALVMNADGTVYHRYGGRDEKDSSSRLSVGALVRLLEDSLADHEAYRPSERPLVFPAKKRTIETIPTMARKLAKKKVDCFHCHFVPDAERSFAQEEGRFQPDDRWLWPRPEQVGLELDPLDATRIALVTTGSAAAKAGLLPGDRLGKVADQLVRSEADLQWVLEREKNVATAVALDFTRGAERRQATLELAAGWKVHTPLAFSWRPSMWNLRPNPGFGGDDLKPADKEKLGLAKDAFAFRVGYIIDWGEHPEDGRNAAKAGIRKGDVVVAVAGLEDAKGHRHFQSWFRLTRKAGEVVVVTVLRGGERVAVKLPVIP
jgi:serine protease Do